MACHNYRGLLPVRTGYSFIEVCPVKRPISPPIPENRLSYPTKSPDPIPTATAHRLQSHRTQARPTSSTSPFPFLCTTPARRSLVAPLRRTVDGRPSGPVRRHDFTLGGPLPSAWKMERRQRSSQPVAARCESGGCCLSDLAPGVSNVGMACWCKPSCR